MRLGCFLRPALRVATCQRFYRTFPRQASLELPRYSQCLLTRANLSSVTMAKSDFSQLMLEMLRGLSLDCSEEDEGGMKRGKQC